MLALGPFRFSIDTLPFQEIARSSSYSWPTVDRIGSGPGYQFTGKEGETMSLPGVFYPHFKGGIAQLPAMRLMAEQGLPLPVIRGDGFFFGLWIIKNIDETQTVFFRDGVPRKIDFVINLELYASVTDMVKLAITGSFGSISRLFS